MSHTSTARSIGLTAGAAGLLGVRDSNTSIQGASEASCRGERRHPGREDTG